MTGQPHDFLIAPAQLGSRGNRASAQRVSPILTRIETSGRHGPLHHAIHSLTGNRITHENIASLNPAEQRAVPPPAPPKPAAKHANRIRRMTPARPNRDHAPAPVLIALRMPDQHGQTLTLESHIGELKRRKLTAPQAGGEPEHDQRAIARAQHRRSITGARNPNQIAPIESALPMRPLAPLAPNREENITNLTSHRRRVTGILMPERNRRNMARSSRHPETAIGKHPGGVQSNRLDRGRKTRPPGISAPGLEKTPVGGISLDSR